MPVIGERIDTLAMSRGYAKDPLAKYAQAFRDVARSIQTETCNAIDPIADCGRALRNPISIQSLKDFYINESADFAGMTTEEIEDHILSMNEQFENNRQGMLLMSEYASMTGYNPVMGLSIPIHKNIMMNNIFDKGAIPKVVAKSPKFTLSMETRMLVGPDGKEIDMYKQQNEMFDAIESTAPIKDTIIQLPEKETVDVLQTTFGANSRDDSLSIETHISQVAVKSYVENGDKFWDFATGKEVVASEENMGSGKTYTTRDQYVWKKIAPLGFVPAYGEYDRQLMGGIAVVVKYLDGSDVKTKTTSIQISGYTRKNKFTIYADSADIKAIKLSARIDTSTAMIRTCSVKWSVKTDIVEIPNANPISVPVSPEEVKDIAALYQVNQLTKLMSMFKLTLGNYKDDKIRKHLDTSFINMDPGSKLAETFDFAPREGYMLDHIEWRHKTFMDALDTHVTKLIQVLNDPNMTITIIGRPDLIRKLSVTEYTYQTPSAIGPVELDFVRTVTTSDKRIYQFISSDKLRGNNNLIVILCPRNSERIIYRIYDYQMYVSNEIRNAVNYALPAIHAFERWKFVEYQPIQARIKILNPTGLKTKVANDDPIGRVYNNDFDPATGYDANAPT